MPWRFRLVERQRGYIFLDSTNARTAAQLGAPAAKKKSYQHQNVARFIVDSVIILRPLI